MKILLQIIVSVFFIVLGAIVHKQFWDSGFVQAGIITLITFLISFLVENQKQYRLFLLTKLKYRDTEIRISVAYLYRIKIDNLYLLVKSRTRSYYQPVGGCYKTLPGAEKIFDKLEIRPDRKFETQKGIAKNDLRINIKGKYVVDFLKWFDSKEDRELSPWREFCEELINTSILPWKQFRFIDYKYKGKVQSPIINMNSGGKGLFIFEVFDLVPNDEQRDVLKKMQDEKSNEFIWLTDEQIQSLGHNSMTKGYDYEISPHTKYTQNLKWQRKES